MNYVEAISPVLLSEDGKKLKDSLFLAGGITGCPDWQTDVVKLLESTDLIVSSCMNWEPGL